MQIYQSPIKTRRQALALAKKLEAMDTQLTRDAASLIRNKGWQYIAARPELAKRAMELSNAN